MVKKASWRADKFRAIDLDLDPQNPRIDVPHAASQAAIRRALIQHEGVLDLANDIAEDHGLLLGERIIVVEEDGRHVVIEGNRRTCACQILLDPRLAEDRKDELPDLSADTRASIEDIAADIAPSRKDAERSITKRHTSPGVKRWSPVAKQRRIMRLVEHGRTISEIAKEFGEEKHVVLKAVREANLLARVRNLKCWTGEQKLKLRDPSLKTVTFTRFFSLKGAKEPLGLAFDDDGEFSTKVERAVADRALEEIARRLLIPNSASKTELNTRATAEDVYQAIAKAKPDLQAALLPSAALGTKGVGAARRRVKPKRAVFFEGLVCGVDDDRLRSLTQEISDISHRNMPYASSFLVRALLESTLAWCVRERGLDATLRKDYALAAGKGVRDPPLSFVLKFCVTRHDEIFCQNTRHVLQAWSGKHHEFVNTIVHGSMILPTPELLQHAAGTLRPFIELVFGNRALKEP